FLLAISVPSGIALELLLKVFLHRPRPVYSLDSTYSFPSGHATLAAVFFFVLAYSFYCNFREKWQRYCFVAACCFLALLIGFSRIYLEMHFASDVIAGFALGIWCVASVMLLLQKFAGFIAPRHKFITLFFCQSGVMQPKQGKSPYPGIAGAVGGTTIAMIALVVVFASSQAWVILPIVLFMSLLGIMLGYFASKK
ncbi:MAG: phosphatase PAP2 family protein, partial [Candidatus Woesearchaeota archaeon]